MPRAPKRHRPFGERKRQDDRQSAADRGYDWRWSRFAKWYLSQEPICRHCKAEGIINGEQLEVDHIIPLRVDESRKYDMDNLQTLCKRHHARKTHGDRRKFR